MGGVCVHVCVCLRWGAWLNGCSASVNTVRQVSRIDGEEEGEEEEWAASCFTTSSTYTNGWSKIYHYAVYSIFWTNDLGRHSGAGLCTAATQQQGLCLNSRSASYEVCI